MPIQQTSGKTAALQECGQLGVGYAQPFVYQSFGQGFRGIDEDELFPLLTVVARNESHHTGRKRLDLGRTDRSHPLLAVDNQAGRFSSGSSGRKGMATSPRLKFLNPTPQLLKPGHLWTVGWSQTNTRAAPMPTSVNTDLVIETRSAALLGNAMNCRKFQHFGESSDVASELLYSELKGETP